MVHVTKPIERTFTLESLTGENGALGGKERLLLARGLHHGGVGNDLKVLVQDGHTRFKPAVEKGESVKAPHD